MRKWLKLQSLVPTNKQMGTKPQAVDQKSSKSHFSFIPTASVWKSPLEMLMPGQWICLCRVNMFLCSCLGHCSLQVTWWIIQSVFSHQINTTEIQTLVFGSHLLHILIFKPFTCLKVCKKGAVVQWCKVFE